MTRTAMLRITTTDPLDGDWRVAISEMTERAESLDVSPTVDVWLSVSTDAEGEPEHPERDQLLALADKWTAEGGTTYVTRQQCADELVRLVATLNL